MTKRKAVISILFLFLIAASFFNLGDVALASFSGTDLSGPWYIYNVDSGGTSEGWAYGTVTFDNYGNVSSGWMVTNTGNGATIYGGLAYINSYGEISGQLLYSIGSFAYSFTFSSGKMSPDKNMIAYVVKNSAGVLSQGTLVKAGGSFVQTDLSGSWYIYNVDSGGTSEGWANGIITFDNYGNVSSGWMVSDSGAVATINVGSVYINNLGEVTGQIFYSFGQYPYSFNFSSGKMSQDKDQIAYVIKNSVGVLSRGTLLRAEPVSIFGDVPPEHYAHDYIMSIYDAQITAGCSTDPLEYCPESGVTREQMATFIVRSIEPEPPLNYCDSGVPFTDVTAGMWSCRFIKRLKELGITGGYPDGRYGSYDPVSREQMAAFLVVADEGAPPENYCGSGVPFTDVTADMWSCGYIKRLAELGVTTGYGDGRYGPYDAVTRAQMAVFLSRAFLGM